VLGALRIARYAARTGHRPTEVTGPGRVVLALPAAAV